MSAVLKTVLVFMAALGIALMIAAELLYRLRFRAIDDRISRVVGTGQSADEMFARPGIGQRLEHLAGRLVDLLAINAVWPRELAALRILGNGLAAGIGTAAVLTLLLRLPWWMSGLFGVVMMVAIPFALVQAEQSKRARAFETMLADTIDMMVRMLRASLPVTVAVERVSQEAQEPAASVYREAAQWLNMGMPLPQAMRTVAERVNIKDFDFFSAALAIQSTVGGNLTETLESLAAIIRERNVSILKARAVTAQARTTANVILGILPTIMVLLQLFRPEYLTPLLDGSHGYGLIAFVVCSYFVALFAIRRLVSRVRIR